jgi:hypothetical protein
MARALCVLTVNERVDNKPRATVRVEENGVIVVRPWRSRKVYAMRVADVANMICWRVAKMDAAWEQDRKRKASVK